MNYAEKCGPKQMKYIAHFWVDSRYIYTDRFDFFTERWINEQMSRESLIFIDIRRLVVNRYGVWYWLLHFSGQVIPGLELSCSAPASYPGPARAGAGNRRCETIWFIGAASLSISSQYLVYIISSQYLVWAGKQLGQSTVYWEERVSTVCRCTIPSYHKGIFRLTALVSSSRLQLGD